MGEQIDQLQKVKNRLEKEKQTTKSEADDLRTQIDHVQKGKAAAEKLAKQLEQQLNEIHGKIEEHVKQVTDLSHVKSKLTSENSELVRQLEEVEHQVAIVTKSKAAIQLQLEEAKRTIEEEVRGKGSVGKFNSRSIFAHCHRSGSQIRNLTADLEQAREQLDEEQEMKSDLQRQVTKLSAEVHQWRSRYESEGWRFFFSHSSMIFSFL